MDLNLHEKSIIHNINFNDIHNINFNQIILQFYTENTITAKLCA